MIFFRASHSSWYQVPVLYGWWDLTAHGASSPSRSSQRHGNGHGNGAPATAVGGASARRLPSPTRRAARPADPSP